MGKDQARLRELIIGLEPGSTLNISLTIFDRKRQLELGTVGPLGFITSQIRSPTKWTFSTTLPFFVAAIGPDPMSALPTARYLPCFSSTTTRNCLSANSPSTFRIPGAMTSAPPTTCGTAPISTTILGMPSSAEVLVKAGAQ